MGLPPPASKVLYVLTGPTAVGKTDLALAWAEANEAEVISCDSLLFYRGMDVGTAKPSLAERSRVPHHLIDICEVTDQMNVTRYVDLVRDCLRGLAERGKRVLVTGGSGFYLRTFFAPVADDVVVPDDLREEIRGKLSREGLTVLVDELRRLDPHGIANIDTRNPHRVARAVERCRATGKTLAQLAAEFSRKPAPFCDWEVRLTVLERPVETLQSRIAQRVGAMLAQGLVDEVRTLLSRGLKLNPSAAKAIGYRETIDFLEGKLAEPELAPTIVKNTRGLVKKQLTWFRTQLPPHRSQDPDTASLTALF